MEEDRMYKPKLVTDYGVLIKLFLEVLYKDDESYKHKSFIRKIQNKLDRFHKRRHGMCVASEERVRKAVLKAEEEMAKLPKDISIGAICWLIQNRHREELKAYDFDKQAFEQMNKHFKAQGVIMSTAIVLNKIEEHMYEDKAN